VTVDIVNTVAEALHWLPREFQRDVAEHAVAAMEPYIAARIAAETERLNDVVGEWAEKWVTAQIELEALRREVERLQVEGRDLDRMLTATRDGVREEIDRLRAALLEEK
jgi:hypothetical protein